MTGFLAATQFLTRIPIRLRADPDLARSAPWFPLVGAVVGVAVGGVAAGLWHVLPASVSAALAVLLGVAITGAFHEDGLADTADALGGMTPQRRREILKDSRHGSYGVAAMVSTVLVRVLCVAALGPAAAFAGLVAAHTLGRSAAVTAMRLARPVPSTGLGADYARALPTARAAAGVLAGLGVATLALGWWIGPALALAVPAAGVVVVLAHRAFEGVSGDLLGAIEQAVECAVLVVVSGLALRYNLWWVASRP